MIMVKSMELSEVLNIYNDFSKKVDELWRSL